MESFFDAEMVTAKFLMNGLMLDYEVEIAARINDPAAFTTTHAGSVYTEGNIETIDVPADVNAMLERMTLLGEVPNCAIMSLHLWNYIRRSKKLQTYVYGYLNVNQGGSQITEQMFGNVFGVPQILVAKKSYDSALKGKSPSVTSVWGNDYFILARLAGGEFMNGGVGRTIIWDADAPGGLFTSESYRNEARRCNMLRVRSNRVVKTMSPNCVQLLDTGASGSFLT
jgi:hypothetical protein